MRRLCYLIVRTSDVYKYSGEDRVCPCAGLPFLDDLY